MLPVSENWSKFTMYVYMLAQPTIVFNPTAYVMQNRMMPSFLTQYYFQTFGKRNEMFHLVRHPFP